MTRRRVAVGSTAVAQQAATIASVSWRERPRVAARRTIWRGPWRSTSASAITRLGRGLAGMTAGTDEATGVVVAVIAMGGLLSGEPSARREFRIGGTDHRRGPTGGARRFPFRTDPIVAVLTHVGNEAAVLERHPATTDRTSTGNVWHDQTFRAWRAARAIDPRQPPKRDAPTASSADRRLHRRSPDRRRGRVAVVGPGEAAPVGTPGAARAQHMPRTRRPDPRLARRTRNPRRRRAPSGVARARLETGRGDRRGVVTPREWLLGPVPVAIGPPWRRSGTPPRWFGTRGRGPLTVCRREGHGVPCPYRRPGGPNVVSTGTRHPGDYAWQTASRPTLDRARRRSARRRSGRSGRLFRPTPRTGRSCRSATRGPAAWRVPNR